MEVFQGAHLLFKLLVRHVSPAFRVVAPGNLPRARMRWPVHDKHLVAAGRRGRFLSWISAPGRVNGPGRLQPHWPCGPHLTLGCFVVLETSGWAARAEPLPSLISHQRTRR